MQDINFSDSLANIITSYSQMVSNKTISTNSAKLMIQQCKQNLEAHFGIQKLQQEEIACISNITGKYRRYLIITIQTLSLVSAKDPYYLDCSKIIKNCLDMNEIIAKMRIKQKKIDDLGKQISHFNGIYLNTLKGFTEALEDLYIKKTLNHNKIDKMNAMFHSLKSTIFQIPDFREYIAICKFKRSAEEQFYKLQKLIQAQSIIIATKLKLTPCSLPVLKLSNEKLNQMDIDRIDIVEKFTNLNNFFLNTAKPLIEKTYTQHFQEELLSLNLLNNNGSDTAIINREKSLIRSLSAQRVNCFKAYDKFDRCYKAAQESFAKYDKNATVKYLENCELIKYDIDKQNPCSNATYLNARKILSIRNI